MHVIDIMVPFFKNQAVVLSNLCKKVFCLFRDCVIDHLSSIFHDHDQMVIQQIY